MIKQPTLGYLLSFAAVSISCQAADQLTPVQFSGDERAFAVVATAVGEAQKVVPFLHVRLSDAVIRLTPRATAAQHVVGYRIGLATSTSTGSWEVLRWSDRVPFDVTLDGQRSVTAPTPELTIPIDGLVSLQSTWLVFAVDISTSGNLGWTYSHSKPLGF